MADPDRAHESPPPEPARRGRLGFSRGTLSLIGAVIVVAFLIWVVLP